MKIAIFEIQQQFTIDSLVAGDIRGAVEFVYTFAGEVGANVFVLAFEVDGRSLGDPLGPMIGPHRVVRRGREDAVTRPFQYGGDVIVWQPSREAACELMDARWREPYTWWALIVDREDLIEVVRSLAQLWPHGYSPGSLPQLLHTVSDGRQLVLLACEGSFIDGRASPDCWDLARRLLTAIAASEIETMVDTDMSEEE